MNVFLAGAGRSPCSGVDLRLRHDGANPPAWREAIEHGRVSTQEQGLRPAPDKLRADFEVGGWFFADVFVFFFEAFLEIFLFLGFEFLLIC